MPSGQSWSHSGPYKLLHFAATLCVAQCYLSGSWRYLLSAFSSLYSLSFSPLTSYVSSDEENINYFTWHWRRGLQNCGGMYWKPDCASQYRMRNLITHSRPCFKLMMSLESTVPYWRLSGDISRTTDKPKLARLHLGNKIVATEEQDDFYLQSILILH